jgi:aspartate/methionine/tyrosine aminotransferase
MSDENISKRASRISPFLVMEVLDRAKEREMRGEEVIHLEVGEPDFPTPECIKEGALQAIKEGKTLYTHSLGLPELRECIAEQYWEKYTVRVSPEQIVVTSGTSPGMLLIFLTILNPNDEVILSDPHYSCYPNFITIADGIPHFLKVEEKEGFQYVPEVISSKITGKTKVIMVNSPSNPTGNLMSKERIEKIASLGPYIISDEIYHGLVYEGKEHTILEFTDRAFVINGFSKLYAMTGWRLGYIIAPKKFIRTIQNLQQNFFISANAFVQWAGIAALREAQDDVARMKKTYNERRVYIIRRLRELGFGITVEPTGAFYVFANAQRYTSNSLEFAFDLLNKTGVGVCPGIDFGECGEGYIRFSYANSLEKIKEAMGRIEKYLKVKHETRNPKQAQMLKIQMI